MPSLSGADLLGPRFQVQIGADNQLVDGNDRRLWTLRDWVFAVRDSVLDFITEYRILRIPLLNWAMIVVYFGWLLRLTLRFTTLYAKHALLTMIITNILLYGLADTLAQTLRTMIAFNPEARPKQSKVFVRYILERGRPRRVVLDEEDDDLLDLGIDPDLLMDEDPGSTLPPTAPEVYHFRRLALFSCWGFIISFFQSPWYAFLNSNWTDEPVFLSTLKRVLSDQLCFSPVSLACFLSYMTIVMEHGDKHAVETKLKTVYLPTLAVNYAVWPAAQFFNFMVVPRALQIPFSSTVGVFWNTYLSLKNAR